MERRQTLDEKSGDRGILRLGTARAYIINLGPILRVESRGLLALTSQDQRQREGVLERGIVYGIAEPVDVLLKLGVWQERGGDVLSALGEASGCIQNGTWAY